MVGCLIVTEAIKLLTGKSKTIEYPRKKTNPNNVVNPVDCRHNQHPETGTYHPETRNQEPVDLVLKVNKYDTKTTPDQKSCEDRTLGSQRSQ
ncbi:MAG: hypothetical protein JRJ38_04570 [Deltaproteobacteria bacterium]|nr:hypothetical protein [Deltaproteobacteria bacterium]